jgi:hypothetical protein
MDALTCEGEPMGMYAVQILRNVLRINIMLCSCTQYFQEALISISINTVTSCMWDGETVTCVE